VLDLRKCNIFDLLPHFQKLSEICSNIRHLVLPKCGTFKAASLFKKLRILEFNMWDSKQKINDIVPTFKEFPELKILHFMKRSTIRLGDLKLDYLLVEGDLFANSQNTSSIQKLKQLKGFTVQNSSSPMNNDDFQKFLNRNPDISVFKFIIKILKGINFYRCKNRFNNPENIGS
jgi:hypothetical protein